MPATVVDFIRFYGGDVLDNGNIPWPWYQLLARWMPNARASEMLSDAKAVGVGAAVALDPEGAKEIMKTLRDEVVRRR